MLDADMIFRTHQSYIANLRFVKSILKIDGLEVKMAKGFTAYLSKGKKAEFLDKLNL